MTHNQQPNRLIYLVDDNNADRKIIEFAIQDIAPDSRIKSFSNPEIIPELEADLHQIKTLPVIVFVDMNLMPGTGIDLIRELRVAFPTIRLQVMAISGQSGRRIWESAYDAGADIFWEKPMTLDEMLSDLVGILSHAQRFPVITEQMTVL